MNGQVMPGVYQVAAKPVRNPNFEDQIKGYRKRIAEAREALNAKSEN